MIVAIDGPAAAGKGTLARRLAAHYGLAYLDTGLIYRAVGCAVLAAGADPGDADVAGVAARALKPEDLEREGLRTEAVGAAASQVAAVPAARAALLAFQRAFAARPPGAVLDGRDIGTIVCPDADVKLFVTASPEVRARRRVSELQSRGETAIYAAVLRDLLARDERDSGRAIAPLQPAADAIRLVTDDLDAEQAFDIAREAIDRKVDRD